MTDRQRHVLGFIRSYVETHGYSPTLREIGTAVGLSSCATVHGHLVALRNSGHLAWAENRPRTLRPTDLEIA